MVLSLLFCVLTLAILTLLVWRFSGWPGVISLLSQGSSASRDKVGAQHEQHDPDLAFIHDSSVWKAAIVAIVSSAAFTGLVIVVTWSLAYLRVTSDDFQVGPAEAEKIGAAQADLLEWLDAGSSVSDDPAAVEPRRQFLRSFTGISDATLEQDEALRILRAFLVVDSGDGSPKGAGGQGALRGFAHLTAEVASQSSSSGALEDYTRSTLTPLMLEVPAVDVYLTQMQTEGKLDTLRSGLSTALSEDPGHKTLIVAAYDKLRAEVLGYRRVHVLFVGWIQGVTFAAFFLAVILLRMREVNLRRQDGFEDQWPEFSKSLLKMGEPKLKTTFERRMKREGSELAQKEVIPILPVTDSGEKWKEDLESHKELLRQYMVSRAKDQHLFALGLAHLVCSELLDEVREGQESAEGRSGARDLVQQVAERNEARIERVEYSWIQYLVYAIPSFGFIGTVLGISSALGSADQVVRATDALAQASAITAVTSILGLAFDTTLVALICGIVVSALISWVRSRESAFLLDVHQRILARMIYGRAS